MNMYIIFLAVACASVGGLVGPPQPTEENVDWISSNSNTESEYFVSDQTTDWSSSGEDPALDDHNENIPSQDAPDEQVENVEIGKLEAKPPPPGNESVGVPFYVTVAVIATILSLAMGWPIFLRYKRWKQRQSEIESPGPVVSYADAHDGYYEESAELPFNSYQPITRPRAIPITPFHRFIMVPGGDYAYIATSDFKGHGEILRKVRPLYNDDDEVPSVFDILTSPVDRTVRNCKHSQTRIRRWSFGAADDAVKCPHSPYYCYRQSDPPPCEWDWETATEQRSFSEEVLTHT